MSVHLTKSVGQVESSAKKLDSLNELVNTLKKQVILRIVSCIQIVSKLLGSNKEPLTMKYIKKCLETIGIKCNVETVLKSEIRVFSTLKFVINKYHTLHDYVEILIEVLGRKLPADWISERFYLICVSVMYKYYNYRNQIYTKLYETISGRTKDLSGE